VRKAFILIPILLVGLAGLFFLLRPTSSAPVPSSPTPSQASPERPQEKAPQDVAIKKETMTPNEVTVKEGDRVRLRITSDEPVQLHLHGYDLEKDITANEPAELEFDATTPGRFQIENEQTHKQLGALLVQLP
jgi:heme/copper-type cytochrome/quinol oxidase subunit 2